MVNFALPVKIEKCPICGDQEGLEGGGKGEGRSLGIWRPGPASRNTGKSVGI